ncbi:hypothetical protein RJ639_040288 [Escallonia herrerae]|uniref:Zn-dependent metallo-hydrolase RNA specificity domain-containing protein n=1 Tax=Escallonia herrerae TaxID=1293975 RepID=A0AA88WI29_9ASTE|nr:hypothetical protein RJ639_040288 [Escallonia herrerae]
MYNSGKFTEKEQEHMAYSMCSWLTRLFDRSLINAPGPCVLFATPGMISGGFSLETTNPQISRCLINTYCVAGTIGHRLMSGKPTKIELDKDTQIDVRCQIHQLSFSPHTDAKGIMDLVKFLSPKHVVLVHGEKPKMALLKSKIQAELGIPSYDPANNETVCISSTHYVKADLSDKLIQTSLSPNFKFLKTRLAADCGLDSLNIKATSPLQLCDDRISEGILIMGKNHKAKVVHQDELLVILGDEKQEVKCANCFPVNMSNFEKIKTADELSGEVQLFDKCSQLYAKLSSELPELNIQDCGEFLQVESFRASVFVHVGELELGSCRIGSNVSRMKSELEALVDFKESLED